MNDFTSIEKSLEIVEKSYGTCILNESFFDDFYKELIHSSSEIALYFENTNMDKQKKFIKGGIHFIIMNSKKSVLAKKKLAALSESHDKNHLNVRPELYDLWKSALIKTVKEYDTNADTTVIGHWQKIIDKGVQKMAESYHGANK